MCPGLPGFPDLPTEWFAVYLPSWRVEMASTASSDAVEAPSQGEPSQGEAKRQRLPHKDVSTSPFAVRSVVVTTDHGAQHAAQAQQLAAELCVDGGLEACVFSPREGETLVKLLERHAAQAILVVGATGTARAACLTEHTARHTHTHTHTHSRLPQHARARAHCRCCG